MPRPSQVLAFSGRLMIAAALALLVMVLVASGDDATPPLAGPAALLAAVVLALAGFGLLELTDRRTASSDGGHPPGA